MDPFSVSPQVLQAKLSFAFDLFGRARRAFAGHAIEPTHRRVVVVSTGIDDNVLVIIVRQVDIFRVTAKSELQDAHAGKSKVVTKLFHVRSNDSQVFSDDRQLPERCPYCREEFPARHFDPTATFGSLVAAGNFPTGGKPAKMIDTRNIDQLQSRLHSLNPPLESISSHAIPVEQRIAPVLAGLAEIIRRDARDHYRRSI